VKKWEREKFPHSIAKRFKPKEAILFVHHQLLACISSISVDGNNGNFMYRIRNISMDTDRRTFLYTYIKTLVYLGPERVKSAWVKTWNLKKYQDPVSATSADMRGEQCSRSLQIRFPIIAYLLFINSENLKGLIERIWTLQIKISNLHVLHFQTFLVKPLNICWC